MARGLTKKEKGFVKDYVRTGNGTQSALNNYDTTDENVAASIASQNLSKLKIENAVKSIADSIPDSLLIEKHLELLTVPKITRTTSKGQATEIEESLDTQAISKGLDMAYKLKGTYAPEKREITIPPITQEALDNAKRYDQWLIEQAEDSASD